MNETAAVLQPNARGFDTPCCVHGNLLSVGALTQAAGTDRCSKTVASQAIPVLQESATDMVVCLLPSAVSCYPTALHTNMAIWIEPAPGCRLLERNASATLLSLEWHKL